MPELPDVVVYLEALNRRIVGRPLRDIALNSPFVLRSVTPPLDSVKGEIVREVSRLGKRIVWRFSDERWLVMHLMIAGRLRWRDTVPPASPVRRSQGTGKALAQPPAKLVLATFTFDAGRLYFTEAGSKKRASLRLVQGRSALQALDPGGLEPIGASAAELRTALARERHTLKRALTDPTLVSGIGNAYSDEILHHARLSPLARTDALTDDDWRRLHEAVQSTLTVWIARLRAETGEGFPERVTAFRDGMAVHGRFKQPCPVCGSPVQRIVYVDHECNYCAACQTGGRVLADRALSRLLKGQWPRTLED